MRHVAYGGEQKAYRVWWVNLKKRDNLQHLGVDGSIILTLLRPDGLLIKYPQFPDVLNTLNVQPHNIFLRFDTVNYVSGPQSAETEGR